MKIGFDAKRAFHNFTGLGNYSRTLIESLVRYYPEHKYHLFTPKLGKHNHLGNLLDTPSVFTHTPNRFFQKISPLWRSYFIKNDIERSDIQIYHGLSHELPLKMPKSVKTVVTIHDLIFERYPQFYPYIDRKLYSWKYKKACTQADIVVAISEQTKQDIIDFYKISDNKIKVIYQACNKQFYLDKPNHSRAEIIEKRLFYFKNPDAEYTILYVGSIIERKNLLKIIEAFNILKDINCQLIVVGKGKGEYYENVKRYVNSEKLNEKVHFFENVPASELPFIYQNVDALVYPSHFEGFGIPIIEALWSGCPVITNQNGCFREASGEGAYYIDPNNAANIANAIETVLTKSDVRSDLILRGGEYVKKFHEKTLADMWINLYKDLVAP